MRTVVACLLLSGCASGTFDRLPGQDEAEEIVWHEFLGRSDSPPPVEWCDAHKGWVSYPNHEGLTIIGSKVQVNYFPENIGSSAPLFSVTEMAHEFIHYDFWLRTGDVDPLHFRADWSIEKKANQKMESVGL